MTTLLAPNLLAFDTATSTASVALYDLDAHKLLAEMTWQARRRHTQDLLATTRRLLLQCDRDPAAVGALAVTLGPGSFTGVRIGLSTVKGIGMGLAQPPRVIGLPTLVVTAAPWRQTAQQAGATVCAYLQAGRGRSNWVWFTGEDPAYRPGPTDHHAGTIEEFKCALAARSEPVWLVGEATPELAAAVATLPHVILLDAVASLRRAGVLAHLAASLLEVEAGDDLAALQPLYLQEP